MDPTAKKILTIFIVVIVCLWIASVIFGFGDIGPVRLGR
jgi:preprotein translocase subunit SecE